MKLISLPLVPDDGILKFLYGDMSFELVYAHTQNKHPAVVFLTCVNMLHSTYEFVALVLCSFTALSFLHSCFFECVLSSTCQY